MAERMRVPLQEYLAGHLVELGLTKFEDALNGLVQQRLREKYPNEGDADHAAAMREHEEEVEKWKARLEEAKAAAEAALALANAAGKKEKKELKKASAKARRAYETFANKEPKPPVDVWVQRVRSVLGQAMKGHVHGEGAWDTFTLVAVLRGLLEEVFLARFGIGDPLEAKGLLSRLHRAAEARNRRAHEAMPKEGETLDLLANLRDTLACCGLPAPAGELGRLLAQAQELKRAAAAEGGERHVAMTVKDQRALLLYRALHAFESQLEEEAGTFVYKDGTYAFGEKVLHWRDGDKNLVKAQSDSLKAVAKARHWLFHHTDHKLDGRTVLAQMGGVLAALRGIAVRNSKRTYEEAELRAETDADEQFWAWEWPNDEAQAEITVVLELSAGGMTIPVPRERCLVGRSKVIQEVTQALLSGSSSRVLVHGHPGMGKDVVASEVVRSEEVAAAGLQLQAWLQGSTDAMLRSQLVDLFETQMPEVYYGIGAGEEERLRMARQWLAAHDSWLLVVEDATWESKALWEYVPAGRGRLLVTSQMPLSEERVAGERLEERQQPLEDVTPFELEGMAESDSIELLRGMNVLGWLGRKRDLEACKSEAELEYICRMFTFRQDEKLPGESEEKQRERLEAAVYEQLECLQAPGTEKEQKERWEAVVTKMKEDGGSKAKARKKLLAVLVTAQLEYRQLETHEGLRSLLSEELGNVPLLVSLCGHILRSMDDVDSLIALYHSVPLLNIDRAGQNPITDRHYLGAVRSVLLLLQRLEASEEAEWQTAQRLLAALSLLPSKDDTAVTL